MVTLTVLVFIVQIDDGVKNSFVDEEVWRMELYLSVGIMALGLLSLLAVTSLPSVANNINWREFSFIQVQSHTQKQTFHVNIYCQKDYFLFFLNTVKGK